VKTDVWYRFEWRVSNFKAVAQLGPPHVRGNDLGNPEMAVSLDFLHFHQAGWK
jgi:hypothetical protein